MITADVRADLKVFCYKTESAMMAEEVLKPGIYGLVLPLIALLIFHSFATACIIPMLVASIQYNVQHNARKARKTALFGLIIPGFFMAGMILGAALAAF